MRSRTHLSAALAAFSALALSACGSDNPQLPAPTVVVASARTDGSILVTWRGFGTATYKVFRGTSAGGEGSTPIATPSFPTYTDPASGLTAGTTYYYTVISSADGYADSPPSPEVHATALAGQNCQSACARLLACAATGAYGYGYGFGFAYGFGYGYGYGYVPGSGYGYGGFYGGYGYAPSLTQAQCLGGCQALDQTASTRIIGCVFAGATCADQLACE